jgi:hypothetical protein
MQVPRLPGSRRPIGTQKCKDSNWYNCTASRDREWTCLASGLGNQPHPCTTALAGRKVVFEQTAAYSSWSFQNIINVLVWGELPPSFCYFTALQLHKIYIQQIPLSDTPYMTSHRLILGQPTCASLDVAVGAPGHRRLTAWCQLALSTANRYATPPCAKQTLLVVLRNSNLMVCFRV